MDVNFTNDLTLKERPVLRRAPLLTLRSRAERGVSIRAKSPSPFGRQQIGCFDTGFPTTSCVAHPSRRSLRDLLRMRTAPDLPTLTPMSGALPAGARPGAGAS